MKIILQSPYLPLSALFITGIVIGFSIYVYSLHRLPFPWKYLLPLLRGLTICLICLTLLQPIWIFEKKEEKAGRIAVLVDNSASMSTGDAFLLPEKVRLAVHLGFVQKMNRCGLFEELISQVNTLSEDLLKCNILLSSSLKNTSKGEPPQPQELLHCLRGFLNRLDQTIQSTQKLFQTEIKKYPYLSLVSDRKDDILNRRHGVLYQRWDNIQGWQVSTLQKVINEERPPDITQLIDTVSIPRNIGSSYGVRIQGYIIPPISGKYQFLICSDDEGILFLSEDESIKKRNWCCQVKSWVPFGEFSRFPEQKSAPLFLNSNQPYYFEAYMKENYGDDHLIIGWIRPDGVREIPIPSEYLRPYGNIVKDYFGPYLKDLYHDFLSILISWKESTQKIYTIIGHPFSSLSAQQLEECQQLTVELSSSLQKSMRLLQKLQDAADVELYLYGNEQLSQIFSKMDLLTRYDWARHILFHQTPSFYSSLQQKGEVDLYIFSETGTQKVSPADFDKITPTYTHTPLFSSIQQIFNRYMPGELSAIVLLSDGIANDPEEKDLLSLLRKTQNIPIYLILPTSTYHPSDSAILQVEHPHIIFPEDTFPIHVWVQLNGLENKTISVQLFQENNLLQEKQILVASSQTIEKVSFFISTKERGIVQYTLKVPPASEERITLNNQYTFSIIVNSDPIKVLMISDYPDWSLRNIMSSIQNDPRFLIDTFFLAQDSVITEGTKPFSKLPELTGTSKYGIIILGDINPLHIPGAVLRTFQQWVQNQGSHLVILAGQYFMPHHYLHTSFLPLLPFRQKEKKDHLHSPISMIREPILLLNPENCPPFIKIGDTPTATKTLWKELPFLTTYELPPPSPHFQTILQTANRNYPVLGITQVGLGFVYVLAAHDIWRWRRIIGPGIDTQFWTQFFISLGTFVAHSPHNPYVILQTPKITYHQGESIPIQLYAQTSAGIPLTQEKIVLECFREDSRELIRLIEMRPVTQMPGIYQVEIPYLPPNRYQIKPSISSLPKNIYEGVFLWVDVFANPTPEYLNLEPSLLQIQQIANRVFFLNQPYRSILQDIQPRTYLYSHRKVWEIWDSLPLFVLVISLLTIEWILRRYQHLI